MRYGCVTPTPEVEVLTRSLSESSDASFEIVSAETTNDSENELSSPFKPSITFHDIFDVYPMDADIVARISYEDDFQRSSEDTVIVVPLAWTSVDQAVCISKLSGNYVKFDVADLPKASIDQFYQLCYCATPNKNVVGVSTPFFFREVHEEELMEFQKEQNKEFWTFRSRFAVLTDMYWNSVKINSTCFENISKARNGNSEKSSDSNANAQISELQKMQDTDDSHLQPVVVSVEEFCGSDETSCGIENKLDLLNLTQSEENVHSASCLQKSNESITVPKLKIEKENRGGELGEKVEAILALKVDENAKNFKRILVNTEKHYMDRITEMQHQLDDYFCEIQRLKFDLQKKNDEEQVSSSSMSPIKDCSSSDDLMKFTEKHQPTAKQENFSPTQEVPDNVENIEAVPTNQLLEHFKRIYRIMELESAVAHCDCEINRLKLELRSKNEWGESISAKLVDQFITIKNLKEEQAAYKKNMECRLKVCAKQYTKLYLKLRQLEERSSSNLK